MGSKASTFVTLLDKNGRDDSRTISSNGIVTAVENNLADWFVKLTITNTGISKTNSGTLTLRIDDAGTFIKSGPILIDEATKNTYLIEMQIKQDLDNDDDFSEPSEQGKVLRGIIGQPQIRIDETFGQILVINIVGIEYRLKETLTSEEHLFLTPNQSFERRIDEATVTSTGLRYTPVTNNLPNAPDLSYIPSNPTRVHDTLSDIIDLLALPNVAGGAFDDFFFDFEPSATLTNHLAVTAEKFGNTVTGVVIDPLSIAPADTDEEQSIVTDNVEYKNHVIMVGSATGGSMPTQRTRFASGFEHARRRSAWDGASFSYLENDLVQITTSTPDRPFLTTYWKAKIDHTSSGGNAPFVSSATWEMDFSVYPPFSTASGAFYRTGEIVTSIVASNTGFYQARNSGTFGTVPQSDATNWFFIGNLPTVDYTLFDSYTPWTNDVDIWKETLAGRAKAQGMSPAYEGWAFDWNITKANYNRENSTSHYGTISPKWVTSEINAQPLDSATTTYDGQRYLLGSSATGSEWSGDDEKVAEYDTTEVTGSRWKFSVAPVDGDVVNDLNVAEIKNFNGSAWVTTWDGDDIDDTDKPSPFHIVENVGLVAGATGISAQAVQFTYNWLVDILDVSGTHQNRTSRGVWFSQSFPFPRLDTSQIDRGELYNLNKLRPYLNTQNMDITREGFVGWNQGINVEDFGKITALQFKIRVGMFRTTAGQSIVEGQPDIPMTFWCIDKFDRVWFSKFKIRRNNQWDNIRIPVGQLAPANLYFARWDELAILNGVVVTELDFTLAEKEFSGVQFDWRFVKHWGAQLDEAYVETGLYKNGHQRAFEFGEDIIADFQANWFWYFAGIPGLILKNILPQHTPVTQNHIRLSAKLSLDDLHFVKEQIVTSDDVAKTDPRTVIEHLATEGDYLNLKNRAIGRESRKRFFPQFWHIRAVGDVRLKFGQKFTIQGTRVPNSPQDMIVSEVTHVYDHDGYHVEIAGIRKFLVSG